MSIFVRKARASEKSNSKQILMCKYITFMCIGKDISIVAQDGSVELESHLLRRIIPHRRERLPVQRRGTVLQQGRQMLWRAVTLVRSQAILGEDGVPLTHHAIALHLGQNRSRGDRRGERIAMNNCSLRQ